MGTVILKSIWMIIIRQLSFNYKIQSMVRNAAIRSGAKATTVKCESKPEKGEKSQTEPSSIHTFTKEEILFLRLSLLSWYDKNKRDLPWRKISCKDVNQSAYATWVSEIMLQQTQVATVINYYNKWMKKWPTLQALAESNVEAVNEAWSGLGYYSRGRRLFEGAQKVVSDLEGQMPKTAQDLEKILPGVGRYTAGAIASIAFGEVTGLVDGNVVRVWSRLRAIGANSTLPEVMELFWQLSHQSVDNERPGDFNQAVMELGATVCTPKLPQCGQCPVQALCRAYARAEHDKQSAVKKICTEVKKENNGKPDIVDIECLVPDCKFCLPVDSPWEKELGVLNFPRKPKKASVKQEELNVVVIQSAEEKSALSKFLICQRPKKGLLAGLWEFPSCTQQDSKTLVSQAIAASCKLKVDSLQNLKEVGEVSHMFSHIHHLYKVWLAQVASNVTSDIVSFDGRPVRWATESEMQDAAISTGMRKVYREYKKSVTAPQSCKRKREPDIVIKDPKKTQSSISDFFKKK
ncbi:hypothetical protein RRG08_059774 [Elysia crispata]|uniref:Adenine DNA glycosylase n=1 Tax=Elysia crispata TaxID=231223 RepID=A0AAE1EDR2_9GAST|nr:hypothetical protein RRG08_059774 [Elysia crispata]